MLVGCTPVDKLITKGLRRDFPASVTSTVTCAIEAWSGDLSSDIAWRWCLRTIKLDMKDVEKRGTTKS